MGIATVNPATGEVVRTFEALSDAEIDRKVAIAQATFLQYRQTSFEQRSQWLQATAAILETDKQRLAALITLEMGKTLKAAIAEVEKCAGVCRYYAENGAKFLADQAIASDASHSFVRYQPLGIILAVMPWNFPFGRCFGLRLQH